MLEDKGAAKASLLMAPFVKQGHLSWLRGWCKLGDNVSKGIEGGCDVFSNFKPPFYVLSLQFAPWLSWMQA